MNLAGYTITEKIYEGNRSVVYRGYRANDDRPVVLKTHKTDYPSPAQINRLRHECEIGKIFNSPGIIKYYNTENYENNLILVTEDFGAVALSNIIQPEGIELTFFLRIAIQLAAALGEIHQRNIIHKDIKSRNILINPHTETVKIIDFGISSQLTRENQQILSPNILEGTLAYISPEQTGRMNRAIDYRTDFYSLGVTLYELVTGRLPFQATDPMELVHAHIAKVPTPPHQLRADLPPVISDIILKLLAKTAEDRYQSAYGLKADLEACLAQWQANGKIDRFALGQYDISDRFQIPQKLYGRQRQIETLLAAFDRVSSPPDSEAKGGVEMMLVTGFSGIGKSALINEIHKPIVRQKGYFISGKFDPFQRNIPYNGVLRAFQELMRQLLTESEEKIQVWKEKLQAALGPNGQIIVDVIPDVELIIGRQPPVTELGPEEAQNRFNLVFQNFIGVFARQEHPLVIFLDDLQWADSASLKLIQLFMTNPDSQYLFFIGAYRDNEVSETHPLILTLDELKKAGVVINQIALAPLEAGHVTELITDTLKCSPEQAGPLTQLLLKKTGGNPFFLNQFLMTLYEEQLLTFAPPTREDKHRNLWRWNIEQIEAMAITDNVVELMAGKIQKLPLPTQHVLQLAACIGNQFDLNTLAKVNEASLSDTSHNLWVAVQEGLILQMGQWTNGQINQEVHGYASDVNAPMAKFLHDRVQQAAYSLIPAGHEQEIHYKVGQLMLKNTAEAGREEKIFDIVNQLNFAIDLITDPAERQELARLNLMAGRKAKAATAYQLALKYLTTGLKLLPPQQASWQSNYDLALALHTEAAETAYLSLDFEQMESLVEVILQQANTLLDKVKAHEIRIQAYMAQNKMLEAVEIARRVLKLLNISLPQKPGQQHIILGLLRTKLTLGRKRIEDLKKLPEMTDPYKLAAMRILMSSASATYIAAPQMFPLIVFHMVNLSVKYGNAPLSSFGYVTYGLILGGAVGDINSGYDFGRFALSLMDRFKAKELKAKLLTVFFGFIKHWKEPAHDTLAPLLEGYQSGLETGDLEYAANCVLMYCYNAFACGRELEWLEREVDKYTSFMQKFKQNRPLRGQRLRKQLILNLTGRAEDKLRFIGEDYNEETMLPRLIEANDQTEICVFHIHKSMLSYLFNDFSQALEHAELAGQKLESIVGQMLITGQNLYHSLALLALYSNAQPKEQKQYLKKVRANQKKMKKWAEHAPANCLHKYYLVEAEYARVLGQDIKAMELYNQAAKAARENEYTQEEALAYELAARFYLTKEMPNVAKAYLMDARYAYLRWGATAKIQELDETYPHLLGGAMTEARAGFEAVETSLSSTPDKTTPKSGSDALDLRTVMKASQTISGEIVLRTLLEELMKIVIENAGAQKGFLILEKEGKLVIEAEGAVDTTEVMVLQSLPIAGPDQPRLATAIVNYVYRTKNDIVLNDASHEGQFTQDRYIIATQPLSILCTPLINQGKLTGILYLENNLTAGAFTPDRLEVLKLLSAQIAISIENASLYTNLEQSEKKYRTLFEDSKDTIFITTPQGEVIDVNQAGLNLFGYTRAEAKQVNTLDLYVNPNDRFRLLREIEQNGSIKDFETRLRKKDGTIIDCLVTATVRQTDDGRILGYQGVIRDITEHKRAEKERAQLLAIQRELDVARNIQASLLPPRHPDWFGLDVVCYSTPAREVGGDFYAYHAFDQGGFALAVGDVSGKGTPAALLMSVSLASLQAIFPQALPPSELLAQLDRTIARYTRTSRQNCALCYAEIIPFGPGNEGAALRVANAGCIPPLVRRVNGRIEWIEAGGLPLGVELGFELGYDEVSLNLDKGDLVILTSDGVVEATNEAEKFFSFDRLEQAVASGPQTSAQAMLDYLRDEIKIFVGKREPHDDLTIVVLQI